MAVMPIRLRDLVPLSAAAAAVVAVLVIWKGAHPRARIALIALKQRILFDLGLYESFELNVRQLQQLDRLLQLRRDDEALPLPKL